MKKPKLVKRISQKDLVELVKKYGTIVVKAVNSYQGFAGSGARFRKLSNSGRCWYRYTDAKNYYESCFYEDLKLNLNKAPALRTVVREMFKYDDGDRTITEVRVKGKVVLKVKS